MIAVAPCDDALYEFPVLLCKSAYFPLEIVHWNYHFQCADGLCLTKAILTSFFFKSSQNIVWLKCKYGRDNHSIVLLIYITENICFRQTVLCSLCLNWLLDFEHNCWVIFCVTNDQSSNLWEVLFQFVSVIILLQLHGFDFASHDRNSYIFWITWKKKHSQMLCLVALSVQRSIVEVEGDEVTVITVWD